MDGSHFRLLLSLLLSFSLHSNHPIKQKFAKMNYMFDSDSNQEIKPSFHFLRWRRINVLCFIQLKDMKLNLVLRKKQDRSSEWKKKSFTIFEFHFAWFHLCVIFVLKSFSSHYIFWIHFKTRIVWYRLVFPRFRGGVKKEYCVTVTFTFQ